MKEVLFHGIIDSMKPTFIVDVNVGRLAKRLRMLGFDTVFVNHIDDDELVRFAFSEGRVLLTKDTGILRRKIVTIGKVKALLIESDQVKDQLKQVVEALDLGPDFDTFSVCMECNHPLMDRKKEDIKDIVPPYVFQTQDQYMQCPQCRRAYWRGTHWQRMSQELGKLVS